MKFKPHALGILLMFAYYVFCSMYSSELWYSFMQLSYAT